MMSSPRIIRSVVSFAALVGVVLCSTLSGQEQEKGSSDRNTAATRQYAAAVALQNREVYDLAGDEWRSFLKNFPNESRAVRARHYLGICELKREQYAQAQDAFRQVIVDDPEFPLLETTYLYMGVAQYRLGKTGTTESYDDAVKTFAGLIKRFPKSEHVPRALFYQAECLYERGNKKEAAQVYARVVKSHPKGALVADAMYGLGVCQEELGQLKDARRIYGAFLKRFAGHALVTEVVMRRGEAEFAASEFAIAEESFAQAANTKGFAMADHATIRQAACLVEQEQYARAAKLYSTVPTNFPKSIYLSFARLWAGKCAFFAGNYAESRGQLEPLLEDSTVDGAEVVHWIASGLLKEAKPSDALSQLERAVDQEAESPFAVQLQLDRADALYEMLKRRGDARKLYARIAEQHAGHTLAPQALYMAGFTALAMGDHQDAIGFATAFMDRNPKDELLSNVIQVAAEGHLHLGSFSAAEALYRRLIEENPKHQDAPQWNVRRGLALYSEKKYRETIDALVRVIPTLQDAELRAEAQYCLGGSYNKLGQYEDAVRALNASLKASSSWSHADEVLLESADSHRRLRQWDDAKARVQELLIKLPESRLVVHAHFRLAEYAYETRDFQTAAKEYQTVIQSSPESGLAPRARYGLGWAELDQGNTQPAIDAFTALIDKHPKHETVPQALYARAVCLHQTKQYEPAIDDLRASLARNLSEKEASDARYLLGLCHAGLDQLSEAADTFRKLLAESPDYAKADQTYYELAWALKALKKEDEAIGAFAELAEKFTDSPLVAESLYHVGEHHYSRGDFDQAAVALDASQKKAGKSDLQERAIHKLGWAYFRLKEFSKAVLAFEQQRSTYPKGKLAADGAFAQGECLFRLQKYREAIAAYSKVRNPSNDEFITLSLLHAGQSMNQLEQWERGDKLLQRCVNEYPDSPHVPAALYESAWANQNMQRIDVALKLYEKVTSKTNTEVAARARFMIGEIYFEKKDHREAARHFFKVAYGYAYPQWQAAAHFEAGRCFEVLRKFEQAKKSYLEVMNKFPESDKAKVAQKRIDALTNR